MLFFQPAEEHYEARHSLVGNFAFDIFQGKESLARPGFDESSYFGYEDNIMIDASLSWVDRQKQPFLLTYLTLSSHHTYKVPAGFNAIPLAKETTLNNYLNTIRYTDRFISRIYHALKSRQLLKNTVFIVLGDHGEGFGEHRRYEHDNVIYQEGLKIPLLIEGPGIGKAGTPIEGLRQAIDIQPTILALLGYSLQNDMALPGRSLLNPTGHKALYTSCWYQNYCMAKISASRKIIYHYGRRGPEIFDIANDPLEKQPILLDANHRGTLTQTTKELLDWKNRINSKYIGYAQQRQKRWISHTATQPHYSQDIMLGEAIRLRGYDISSQQVKPGDTVEVRYHFETIATPEKGWKLFVHVVNEAGRMVLNADHIPVEGSMPLPKWQKGQFIIDRHRIRIPANAKTGKYTVMIGLWNARIRGKGDLAARALPRGRGADIDTNRRVRITTIRVTHH